MSKLRGSPQNVAFLFLFLLSVTNVNILASKGKEFSNNYNTISDDELKTIANKSEFSDNKIIVVLKKKYSIIDKQYSKNDFPGIDLSSIELLTKGVETVIKRGDESSEKIDANDYRAILCLTLNKRSKEGVLRSINILNSMEKIESAEPDLILHSEVVNPNDIFYRNNMQWGLNGTAGIDSPLAWGITSGLNSVKVGVIDTGIKASHPDLVNRVNVELSRDFSLNAPYIPSNVTDSRGHGSHVAGIIGAQGNNEIGITGVCQDIQLVSLKITPENLGDSFATQLIRAVDYAIEKKIMILNNSNGTDNFTGSITFYRAFETILKTYPGLFVTSAGNSNINNDLNYSRFPSNIRLPNLIAVGAHDNVNRKCGFSNFGRNNVDIFAPGSNILSTLPFSVNYEGYGEKSGTSMATPHVTGVAALLLAKYPNLSGAAMKEIIMNGAVNVLDENGNSVFGNLCVSQGKLNAYNAVNGYKTLEEGTNTGAHLNLNKGKGLFGYYQYGSDFVKITVQATKSNGGVVYPEGSFRLLNAKGEIVKKCEINDFADEAINSQDQNSFTVFLPHTGYYYIDVDYNQENLTDLTILIGKVDSYTPIINLFNYDSNEEFSIDFMQNGQSGDSIKRIIFEQSAKYNLTITTSGFARLVVVKRDSPSAHAGLNVYKNQVINGTTTVTLSLTEGIYYIGYFNLDIGSTADITLSREITQYGSDVLIPDAFDKELKGSQINVVERDIPIEDRSYGETYITEGFTRLIYLNAELAPDLSRESYYWYSSNEDIATVSRYGTVFAKNVSQNTTIEIMAVYRYDMSKVFVKEFTILNDLETYASSPLDIEISMNVHAGITTSIDLSNAFVPINILQYYEWVSSNSNLVTIENWGRIYCSYVAIGSTVLISGVYQFNRRVEINIMVNIIS